MKDRVKKNEVMKEFDRILDEQRRQRRRGDWILVVLVIIVLIVLMFTSCGSPNERYVMEPPFIIIKKTRGWEYKCGMSDWTYCYQDRKGDMECFCEEIERYNIGDTIR